jgi:hypothetical protein
MLGSHLLSFAAESYSFDPLPPKAGTSYDDDYFSQLWRGGNETRRSGPASSSRAAAGLGLRGVEDLIREGPAMAAETMDALRRLLADRPGDQRRAILALMEGAFDPGNGGVGGAPGGFPFEQEELEDADDGVVGGAADDDDDDDDDDERDSDESVLEEREQEEAEGQVQNQTQGGLLMALRGMLRGWTGTGGGDGDVDSSSQT